MRHSTHKHTHTHVHEALCPTVVSVPVGYQRVEGEEEEEVEGEKGQELSVMNGTVEGTKKTTAKNERNLKPPQSHTATRVYIMFSYEILYLPRPLPLP